MLELREAREKSAEPRRGFDCVELAAVPQCLIILAFPNPAILPKVLVQLTGLMKRTDRGKRVGSPNYERSILISLK
jgi:hypothetical protein